jgi:DNA-binding beta-propeller fold protein YncE
MRLHNALAIDLVDDLRPIHAGADPCGVGFDPHGEALYVADAYSGAIVRVDGDRQRRIATVESAGMIGVDRVGAIAITTYGTLFATRQGSIIRIEPDGQHEVLEGLPARFTRLGLTYDPREHALYTTQFVASRQGANDGSIVMIDLVTGTPSTIADGFAKPVGIAKLGSTLVVADARQRAVFRVELASGRAVYRLQVAGDIDRPEALCSYGRDSVLVTTYDEEHQRGSLRRLWFDGRRKTIASGPWQPRAVATDGERAFVAMKRGGVMVFMVAPDR